MSFTPSTRPHADKQRWLLLVLLLAFVLRAGHALGQDHMAPYTAGGGDSGWYLLNGHALVAGMEAGEFKGRGVELTRLPTPPLYLLFVGLWQEVLPPEQAIIMIRLLQAALGAATCLLAYHLARIVGHDERAGLAAAAVLAVSPAFVMEPANILTETLYIFLLTAGLWQYLRGTAEGAGLRALALCGLLLGLATLTRPVPLLFPVVLALHLLLRGRRAALRPVLTLLLVYALVILSWTAYNLVRWGRVVIVSDQFSAFLYVGAAGWESPAAVDAALEGQDPAAAAGSIITGDPAGYLGRRVGELLGALLQPHGTAELSGPGLREMTLEWLREDRTPGGLASLTTMENFWPKLALYLFHYAGVGLGLAGLWYSRKHDAVLPLAAFIAYTLLIHLVLLALPRYIFPTQVLLWALAAPLLVHLWDARRARKDTA